MTISKRAQERISKLPEVERPQAIQREHERTKKRAQKTREANLLEAINNARVIRETAKRLGIPDKVRSSQVEIRYLKRKLAELRSRR
jgi:hypothetical protein